MQASAFAPVNIALVKYWGKRDVARNLPAAGSMSVSLQGLGTTTHVHFQEDRTEDVVRLDGREDARTTNRVRVFLDHVRATFGRTAHAEVETTNDVPAGAGLASSASGFAALAVATNHALDLGLDRPALSALARVGSGSAARSLIGGFAEMLPGEAADGHDAFAVPLAPADHLPLRIVVGVTRHGPKAVSSTEGMERSRRTSPYHRAWISQVRADLAALREALERKDLDQVCAIAETNALRMHADMLASVPPLVYWNGATVEAIRMVQAMRADGVRAWITIDAGPQIKVLCHADHAETAQARIGALDGVLDVRVVSPGRGAHLLEAPA